MKLPFRAIATPRVASPNAAVPDAMRVYAIGDVHGRADLLGRMADLIGDELRTKPVREALTICLGDYIDRGPASAEVLDRLARGDFPTPLVTLRGNHENIFQHVLRGSMSLETFFSNGGDATLRSYGLDPSALLRRTGKEIEDALRTAIPLAHRAFLDATRLSVSIGDYFFCHAGARPGVALDRQSPEDLMWIREEFLRSSFDFGKIIIHGHTPVKTPQVRVNGIDIDTKAFASGVLTAVVLEGTERRFLQATP